MPIIQLTPHLQHTVRLLKLSDLRKDGNHFLTVLPLSKQESSALAGTFNRPASTRQKELIKLSGDWN